MTETQTQLLIQYYNGKLSKDQLKSQFGKEIDDIEFIKSEIREAVLSQKVERIENAICLILLHEDKSVFINELNILLIDPNHKSHQVITKTIQDIGNPKSIPYIIKALETNFTYLSYTCSESRTIAKWFSWALYQIGTEEAINVIKHFTKSHDIGISEEMKYRLKKVEHGNL